MADGITSRLHQLRRDANEAPLRNAIGWGSVPRQSLSKALARLAA